jgi:hypothetical protein
MDIESQNYSQILYPGDDDDSASETEQEAIRLIQEQVKEITDLKQKLTQRQQAFEKSVT